MEFRKGQHHHFLGSSWLSDWILKGIWILQNSSKMCFWLIFTIVTVFTTDVLSLLLLLLLPNSISALFFPLRLLFIETCSRASIMVRLRSQYGFRPKMASLMSRRPCLVPFLWGPPTLSASTCVINVLGFQKHELDVLGMVWGEDTGEERRCGWRGQAEAGRSASMRREDADAPAVSPLCSILRAPKRQASGAWCCSLVIRAWTR